MNTDETREAIWQAALHYQHSVASEYRLEGAIAKHEAAIKAEAWDEGHDEPTSCCGLCPAKQCPWDDGKNGPTNPYKENTK